MADKQTIHTPVLIIGSGAAGCTAAIYAARAGKEPVMVHGLQPGGQLTITTDVENYPGFADVIQGPWLMEQMAKQAEHVGTRVYHDYITSIDFSKRPFVCQSDSGNVYIGDTLILCTGATAKWLGLPSEQKFQNFGVSACATCDGFFYRGKDVAVIGGGNTACEEALFLAGIANSVTMIHRRDSFRSEKILQNRLFKNPKIKVIWDHEVDEFLGAEGKGLTGLRIKSTKTGATQEVTVHGAFVAIGHKPNSELYQGAIDMDHEGYVTTQLGSTKTNITGVFAAGDLQDKVYRQAVTAAGTGCMAALEADRLLIAEENETEAVA